MHSPLLGLGKPSRHCVCNLKSPEVRVTHAALGPSCAGWSSLWLNNMLPTQPLPRMNLTWHQNNIKPGRSAPKRDDFVVGCSLSLAPLYGCRKHASLLRNKLVLWLAQLLSKKKGNKDLRRGVLNETAGNLNRGVFCSFFSHLFSSPNWETKLHVHSQAMNSRDVLKNRKHMVARQPRWCTSRATHLGMSGKAPTTQGLPSILCSYFRKLSRIPRANAQPYSAAGFLRRSKGIVSNYSIQNWMETNIF